MQIVQVDQKFLYHKPIKAGDKVCGPDGGRSPSTSGSAPTSSITRNVCTDEDGEVVLEAFTTLMGHEGDNSISVKWDPETGQVVRTGRRTTQSSGGLVTRTWRRCTLGPRGFPSSARCPSVSDRPNGERANCVSPGRVRPASSAILKGRSSTGRAAVSKTAGCRFKSCRPCSTEYSTGVDTGR